MWYEVLPAGQTWSGLWYGYVLCGGRCPGIRRVEMPCPACGAPPMSTESYSVVVDGKTGEFPATFMGAEGRYEDYVYLQMLQREWERPVNEFVGFAYASDAPSARAALVLLFWGYFETRMERLLRTAMRALPRRVLEDQLRRYSGIGSRLYDLYRIYFETNYFDDLRALGHEAVADLLTDLHARRNEFAHGHPKAISDAVVARLVCLLKEEHEGWIAVYNKRVSAAAQ